MNGSPEYGERVVIIEVRSGSVRLKKGHISSTASSHVMADNQDRTVVWGDRRFYPLKDASDDAFEKMFQVNDIHLLKQQEAQSLRDFVSAQDWFGPIYQDRLVHKIHRSLKKLRLDE